MITKNPKKEIEIAQFVYLSDLVPADHLVRKIEKAIAFTQYLFGIRSMRQTIEEIKVNVAYRYFLGLGLTDEVPHHSTFGKNYVRRYQNTTIFSDIFKKILEQACKAGFIKDESVFVDSTHIKAYANKNKRQEMVVKEQLSKYEKELNEEINNLRISEGKDIFTYSAQTACDENGFVLGSVVIAGNVHDSKSFLPLYEETIKDNENIENIVVDAAYKTPVIANIIQKDNKEIYGPYKRAKTKKGYLKKQEFEYHEEGDYYTCPMGVILNYKTTNRNGYR